MPPKSAAARENSVSLHIAASFPSAWQTVVLPWFEAAALKSLERSEPSVVVTPSPSVAAFLRSKLLEHKISLLGVRFLTPPRLRELLLADPAALIPLREHLRLLLAIAAESTAATHREDVDRAAIARSISHAPDNLLRVFDEVSTAGGNFETMGPPAASEIIKIFQDLVRSCRFKLVHEADRAALESPKTGPARFDQLLLFGFTAEHWPLWILLRSAVLSARRAAVILEYPREQTRAADESWIGTWEENFQPAEPIADQKERARPFGDLIQCEITATDSRPREQVQFLVGLNATEQAQAITALALKFLEEDSCTRLGLLFPRNGALPRLVSELLIRAGVQHSDGIGHLSPNEFEAPAWNAWLELQENHQLEVTLRFLESNPDSLGSLSIHDVRNKLRRAYREILIDDIQVLREYCSRQTEHKEIVQIAKLLSELRFLPSRATLPQFLDETNAIFTKLKWDNRWAEIARVTQQWSADLSPEFSRAIYLRWLKEILDSFEIARAAEGKHVYSRIHLLPYAEAEGQEWSHLILAGLNQGEWPEVQHESGLLPDAEISKLNSRAARSGKQGEGHLILAKGKTFLLSTQDRRQIDLRKFAAALESVECGAAITASLLQESAPERLWNPSEVFSQVYFATHATPLSQETMSMLREKTSAWLKKLQLFNDAVAADAEINQTRTAYDFRRRADVPFGEYEFALRAPVERQIALRATEWDKVVKTPALIWLKTYLGIENQEPDLNQWNAATGSWVHDWLARLASDEDGNRFVDFPSRNEIRDRIAQTAKTFRQTIVDLCAACGRTVPDWWSSGWSNAFALADFLSSKLAEAGGWQYLAAEWNLDSPQNISLNEQDQLRLRGRIDLILARDRPNESELGHADIWIIDYKTGNVKPLSASGRTPELRFANLRKKLVRGDAIQLGLYGLAARELGATEINLSILSLRTDLDRPQLAMTDLAAHSDFWAELYRMQETGVFGLRGLIRNEFGFNPDYPLATLPIDKEFLDEKWVLTHPAFADDEDDRS